MKFSGYFLIVWDFIRFAKQKGIPVGPGPWIGRRQPGELRDGDHRYRSAGLRAAVRALPESRAHLHARYRHRFLHARARRSDPVRDRKVRPRAGGPDHHVRHAGRARRDQGRGPRAGRQLRRRGAHHQADPDHAAEHQARRGAQDGAADRRAGSQGTADAGGSGRRAASGRRGAQCQRARGGRGDRAAAAPRTGSALQDQQRRNCHAVRHGGPRKTGPAQDGFPGADDADHHRRRAGADQTPSRRDAARRGSAARRSRRLTRRFSARATPAACSSSNRRACATFCGATSRTASRI